MSSDGREFVELDDASSIELYRAWIGAAEAAASFASILSEYRFETRSIRLFGRDVLQPREIAWAGDAAYTYSRDRLDPRPWSRTLRALRDRVSRVAGVDFNHALLNHYRDGKDSMGAHSDDERELGAEPTIASLSFGAARTFRVHPRRGSARERLDLELRDGDLLVMRGKMQERFRHSVPKAPSRSGRRLNITFRRVDPS